MYDYGVVFAHSYKIKIPFYSCFERSYLDFEEGVWGWVYNYNWILVLVEGY
jgi:hypothetical protein